MKWLLDPTNESLQNSIRKIINRRGDLRNTALHHAARLWPGKPIYVTELKGNLILVVTHGTGPLACLSLFPVAELDKVSYD